jgi:hypothetical protein
VKEGSLIPIQKPTGSSRSTQAKVAEWEKRNETFASTNGEHDVIVNIDQSNLSLWFRKRTKDMVTLLKTATGVELGWDKG